MSPIRRKKPEPLPAPDHGPALGKIHAQGAETLRAVRDTDVRVAVGRLEHSLGDLRDDFAGFTKDFAGFTNVVSELLARMNEKPAVAEPAPPRPGPAKRT